MYATHLSQEPSSVCVVSPGYTDATLWCLYVYHPSVLTSDLQPLHVVCLLSHHWGDILLMKNYIITILTRHSFSSLSLSLSLSLCKHRLNWKADVRLNFDEWKETPLKSYGPSAELVRCEQVCLNWTKITLEALWISFKCSYKNV